MSESDLQTLVRERLGFRLGRETAAYVLRRLTTDSTASATTIPVMGGNARTGMPARLELEPAVLHALLRSRDSLPATSTRTSAVPPQ